MNLNRKQTMTKSEEINQILHQHIKVVFKDCINYKELIQALLKWNEEQSAITAVVQVKPEVCDNCGEGKPKYCERCANHNAL